MYEEAKARVLDAARKMREYELVALTGGNVSCRMPDGNFLITPSGMDYFEIAPEDILVLDGSGKVIEGAHRPSVDTVALLYIYEHMEKVNVIIHTHQPYATAIGLVEDELPCFCSTLANATRGSVAVTPYAAGGSVDMGKVTVEHIGNKSAVIIKQHGVISVGADIMEALYGCVYLEEAAKTYCVARSMANEKIGPMDEDDLEYACSYFEKSYGQK